MVKKSTWAIGTIVILGLLLILISPRGSSFEEIENFQGNINIYKSSSCGCCGIYANYFQTKGTKNAKVVTLESVNLIKENNGVPKELESCHTTIIGDYFVEGHIPLEAIEKLLTEKPDIKGIAMPGMPLGSPGMPGTKTEEFIIYAVNHDGSYQEFMRI